MGAMLAEQLQIEQISPDMPAQDMARARTFIGALLSEFSSGMQAAVGRLGVEHVVYLLHTALFYPIHIGSQASSQLLVNALASAMRDGPEEEDGPRVTMAPALVA